MPTPEEHRTPRISACSFAVVKLRGVPWRLRKRLCKLGGMPGRYGSGYGAAAPSLFHRGRGGRRTYGLDEHLVKWWRSVAVGSG